MHAASTSPEIKKKLLHRLRSCTELTRVTIKSESPTDLVTRDKLFEGQAWRTNLRMTRFISGVSFESVSFGRFDSVGFKNDIFWLNR